MKALNTIIQCCYRRYICHQRLISDETLISLTLFFKITETGLLEYLFNVTPQISYKYNTRTLYVTTFYCRTDIFRYSFFQSTIMEWNKVDIAIRRSESLPSFRYSLLKLGRPTAKQIYHIFNLISLKLTRLRLSLGHLNEHKFKHDF